MRFIDTIGVITFDLQGRYFLDTFGGRLRISEEELTAMTARVRAEEPDEAMLYDSIAGTLARGTVCDDEVIGLSIRKRGREWGAI